MGLCENLGDTIFKIMVFLRNHLDGWQHHLLRWRELEKEHVWHGFDLRCL